MRTKIAGTHDHFVIVFKFIQQPWNVPGVVLAVSIHENKNIPGCISGAALDGSAIAHIHGMRIHLDAVLFGYLHCFICRPIINDNDLEFRIALKKLWQNIVKRRSLVFAGMIMLIFSSIADDFTSRLEDPAIQ